jgi:hypothetical protein
VENDVEGEIKFHLASSAFALFLMNEFSESSPEKVVADGDLERKGVERASGVGEVLKVDDGMNSVEATKDSKCNYEN